MRKLHQRFILNRIFCSLLYKHIISDNLWRRSNRRQSQKHKEKKDDRLWFYLQIGLNAKFRQNLKLQEKGINKKKYWHPKCVSKKKSLFEKHSKYIKIFHNIFRSFFLPLSEIFRIYNLKKKKIHTLTKLLAPK